jgi:hypothetical protein
MDYICSLVYNWLLEVNMDWLCIRCQFVVAVVLFLFYCLVLIVLFEGIFWLFAQLPGCLPSQCKTVPSVFV